MKNNLFYLVILIVLGLSLSAKAANVEFPVSSRDVYIVGTLAALVNTTPIINQSNKHDLIDAAIDIGNEAYEKSRRK